MKCGYLTVKGVSESEYIVERSKFITAVFEIESEENAKQILADIKKKHPFATHNCYAYTLLDGTMRFSDDGEPQGTAGLPILEVIKRNGLFNTLVVVTRYFGGIKLGAGGLVRAYSTSASTGLKSAKIVKYLPAINASVTLSYEKYGKFLNFIEGKTIIVTDTVFDSDITVKVIIPQDLFEGYSVSLTDYFIGGASFTFCDHLFYPFEDKGL